MKDGDTGGDEENNSNGDEGRPCLKAVWRR
jgi:hypothetical protein